MAKRAAAPARAKKATKAAAKKTASTTKATTTKKTASTKKATTAKTAAKSASTKKATTKTAASATSKATTKATAKKVARTATANKATAKKATAKKSTAKKPAAKKLTSAKKASRAARAPQADWLVGPLAPLRALAGAVADLGVHAVDDEESQDGGEALRETYAEGWSLGTLWSDALWEACAARVRPLRLWATGPTMRDAMGSEVTPSLFVDPAEPDRLWYTPTTALPAALFVPLPATREAIAQALAELGPHAKPVEPGEARSIRAYMGAAAFLRVPSPYSGELEPAGPHELDRHFNFSPVVTPHAWGSAYRDDPLLGGEPTSTLQSIVALREMREQLEEALPRFTRRAYFSQAHVAIEMHARGHYVWDISYRPSRLGGGRCNRNRYC